jgi:hypothetical protein
MIYLSNFFKKEFSIDNFVFKKMKFILIIKHKIIYDFYFKKIYKRKKLFNKKNYIFTKKTLYLFG